jgi:hypothetical protein
MKKILIAFNVFISVFIVVNLIFVYSFFMVKKDYKNKNVNITKGKSFQQIYKELGLNYEMIDKIYLKITGNSSNLKIGTYRFNGKYSRYEIVRKIQNKESNGVRLTIPEGFTKKQVYERINALGLGTEAEIEAALKEINFPYPHENNNFEGYFYPETYIFPEGVTTKQVIKTVLSEFLKKFPPEKYPDKNKFYDQLKLASIVEAEVSDAADKPKVAGVFIKRLKIDMKLESDATLKYELGRQALKGELKSKESPYNSYKVKGLPPTPIGNPPFDTFQAVEKAEVTDNLFFFTYKGKTYYSKTHDEHIQKRKETGQLK